MPGRFSFPWRYFLRQRFHFQAVYRLIMYQSIRALLHGRSPPSSGGGAVHHASAVSCLQSVSAVTPAHETIVVVVVVHIAGLGCVTSLVLQWSAYSWQSAVVKCNWCDFCKLLGQSGQINVWIKSQVILCNPRTIVLCAHAGKFKKQQKCSKGRWEGMWMGPTNTGLSPRRPVFVSCVKPKVDIVMVVYGC